jgi:glycosyltransferase involved in cell wall biosynthesis
VTTHGTRVQRPSVSVIVPVHDAGPYLAEALDSVLAQKYEPLELVVVDDGSTDDSAAIAAERPVRLIRRPHSGIASTRNAGVAAANGELIAFLDADDLWLPDTLALRVEHLIADPELGYVLARIEIFGDAELTAPSWLPADWVNRPQPGMLPTFVGRATLVEKIGGFDEGFVLGEDGDWLARLGDAGVRGEMLDTVCTRCRRHPGNTTLRLREHVRPTLVQAIRGSIERKRAAEAL